MDLFESAAIIVQAAAIAARNYDYSSRKGCIPLPHQHRSVCKIYNCLGPLYFWWAYRKSFESFWWLHSLLLPHIKMSIHLSSKYEKKVEDLVVIMSCLQFEMER